MAHDRLVIALDLYVWKLLRVDMGRSVGELKAAMLDLCAGALGVMPADFATQPPASLESADV